MDLIKYLHFFVDLKTPLLWIQETPLMGLRFAWWIENFLEFHLYFSTSIGTKVSDFFAFIVQENPISYLFSEKISLSLLHHLLELIRDYACSVTQIKGCPYFIKSLGLYLNHSWISLFMAWLSLHMLGL